MILGGNAVRLTLKNIGKVENAVVDLNGITVIAGENNTGKSTVGKALFSFFNSFYNVKNKIANERKQALVQIIDTIIKNFPGGDMHTLECYDIAEEIINSTPSEPSRQNIERIITNFADDVGIKTTSFDDVINRIIEVLKISDDQILKKIITKQIESEFSGQISNIYTEMPGSAELTIKGENASFDVKDDTITDFRGNFDLNTEVVYIDNPFVLDEQRFLSFMTYNSYLNHKNHLRSKLFLQDTPSDIINEIINTNKLNDIYEKISTICSGEMVNNKRFGYGYKKKDSDKIIDVKNISTGLKTFVILKTLLQNGTLQYNGVIILDEPEIHLHPQWQLLFAELIVLIQKEFNMHILLNTHSPYFLKAIEVYSAKHEIADKCNYYLAHLNGNTSVIDDVTSNPEKIYKLLAKPLQDLENVRYEND